MEISEEDRVLQMVAQALIAADAAIDIEFNSVEVVDGILVFTIEDEAGKVFLDYSLTLAEA